MIHVVFNHSEIALIKAVTDLDWSLSGHVIQIRDDFAVGPVAGLDTGEGVARRAAWWKEILAGSPYPSEDLDVNDPKTLKEITGKLDDDVSEQVWIWVAQNQHDVCGYYWLVSRMKSYVGRVYVINVNNLPFINEKGQLFYPSWLHEIRPKELLKAKRLARPITPGEFEVDADEWQRLATENSGVRFLEGGKKITGRPVTFYDADILSNISSEWQRANRVLSNTLNRMKIKTGDVFLMWRMKSLIAEGKLEVMGHPEKGWKEFDVRRMASEKESEPQATT